MASRTASAAASETRLKGGKFKRVLKKSAIAVVVFVVAVVAINQYDPPLSSRMQAIQAEARQAPKLLPAENGFFYTLGLLAPKIADPVAVGKAWFDQSQLLDAAEFRGEAVQERRDRLTLPARPTDGASEKETRDGCDLENCLANAIAHPEAYQSLVQANADVLARLETLMAMPFEEPGQPYVSQNTPFAFPTVLGAALTSHRIGVASLFAAGKDPEAIAALVKSNAFLLRVFAGSHSLLGKMVSASLLHRQQALLMAFVQTYPERAKAQADAWLPLLTVKSDLPLGMSNAAGAETLWQTNLVLAMRATSAPWTLTWFASRMVMAPQATANLMAQTMEPWFAVELQTLGSAAYWTAVQQYRSSVKQGEGGVATGWFWLYNPVGKVLAMVGQPNMLPYLYRRDNILADRRLLALQWAVAQLPTRDKAGVDALLARPEYRHPFDGSAPVWTTDGHGITYTAPADTPATAKPLGFKAL